VLSSGEHKAEVAPMHQKSTILHWGTSSLRIEEVQYINYSNHYLLLMLYWLLNQCRIKFKLAVLMP